MTHTMKRLWQGFWQLADPKIWIASTVPMLIAAALAYAHTKTISIRWFAIALIGIYLIEIGKNAVNEFVDYLTGVDRYITPDKRNPFSGGKKTIVDGKLTIMETAIIAIITLLGAFVIGVMITILKEPTVFWIGMAGGALAVFYSLPPFKLNYNGGGELAVGITFGPLLIAGMYIMLTGQLDWTVIAVGLPIAFLIMNVLWVNQYPDYEADMQGGKRNWLVRIGKRQGLKVYIALFAGNYISLIALAFIFNNPLWLLGFITIPLARQAVQAAYKHIDEPQQFLQANAKTIFVYQITGVTMIAASLIQLGIF